MKLTYLLTIIPFAVATATVIADTHQTKPSTFNFSTKVTRTVDKDLMHASVYSQKSGKSLIDLKKGVSLTLNQVVEEAKKYPSIEIQTEGMSNRAIYNTKGNNIEGWEAIGRINLKSKDFESMAKVLENLGKDVAISYINFSVSPEKLAELEDEMTLEIIRKFQHKADIIQKGLAAKNYKLSNINIETPNDGSSYFGNTVMYSAASMERSAGQKMEEFPLEAGKTVISASASGNVEFE
ncbi:SIMPL domain-containing protein [Mannheimia sp. AT1]|uniref:SIMPL domain-containing protein n=1 Tax=Mannheimia cairinae TaxID=3025936 RepID=A0ABT5MML2_9PAST|nr:SIMPL domain-containing protein [Mannheimia cairinae]MDD0823428.1 SIMPL domain-containing protein [Mannheimia cairinae]MDD0826964.1 SIMPL domain-containing protein [Mannheimia cairinae]